jgi:hypothetical protein
MASFTSVLKKIGQVILTGSGIATEVMQFPFVSSIFTGLANKLGGSSAATTIQTVYGDLNSVASIISMMEVAFPTSGSGAQKLAAASPLVQQVVLQWAQSSLPGHNSIKVDPATFAAHCSQFTSDFVNIMNDFGA